MNSRRLVALPALVTLLGVGACAHHETLRAVASPAETTVAAAKVAPPAPSYVGKDVSVSGDIMRACKVVVGNVDRAPKFDFDTSALLPEDRSVLEQIASCVTVGPLKGDALKLVGRADPRGEVEYNFSLGEHRAAAVETYLSGLGVAKAKMVETSRGKLDATGMDEAGWARDRRVDIAIR